MLMVTFDLPMSLSIPLGETFNDLPLDEALMFRTGDSCRKRRLSRYYLRFKGGIETYLLPHEPFMQSEEFNRLLADQRRDYSPLTINPSPLIELVASKLQLNKSIPWEVGVHQIRIECSQGKEGRPVPEGAHRDGYHYVAIIVVHRENIRGGKTFVTAEHPNDFSFEGTLEPSTGVVFDDEKLVHYTSPIEAVSEEGHRDVFIITFIEWFKRRCSGDFNPDLLNAAPDKKAA